MKEWQHSWRQRENGQTRPNLHKQEQESSEKLHVEGKFEKNGQSNIDRHKYKK